jgi:hypothetical protein
MGKRGRAGALGERPGCRSSDALGHLSTGAGELLVQGLRLELCANEWTDEPAGVEAPGCGLDPGHHPSRAASRGQGAVLQLLETAHALSRGREGRRASSPAPPPATTSRRSFFDVEPQLGLALVHIRPVTADATIRQDRPHLTFEVDAIRWLTSRGDPSRPSREQRGATGDRALTAGHRSKLAPG